jgi:type II secretory pathway pseudopilin PulG
MTLVELLVAMAILSIVMLVLTTTLSSIQRAVVEEDVRIRLNDQARLAVQSIDRLVRSGNILYDPVDESGNDPYDATATGYMFRIYTQAEQTGGQDARCALWLVNDDQQLMYRTWPILAPEDASDWSIVAESVVNRDLDEPAFTLDPAGRTIAVEFYVNPDLEDRPQATQVVEASLTGRNTSFGYPVQLCSDLPDPLT